MDNCPLCGSRLSWWDRKEPTKCRWCGATVQPPPPPAPTLFEDLGEQIEELNLTEGQRLRDVGTTKVREHTPDDYRERFEAQVRSFLAQGRPFTSEDVTAEVGQPPNHPNAVGALTRAVAIKYGARKMGRVQATRKNQHASEIAVWGWA